MTELDSFREFYDSEFGSKIIRLEGDYVRENLKDCQKILDIGCGIGVFERYLEDLNIQGIDINPVFIEEARKRSNKIFQIGDITSTGFDSGSFDGIFAITSLEFIEELKDALSEIDRILEKNGKIVFLLLNTSSEYFKRNYEYEDSYFRKIKHKNFEVSKLAKEQFIIETDYFLGIKEESIFETKEKDKASIFVIKGKNK
ncbi:MAG: class I SAM-dependent methyltransferase [Candidatus Ranarchaeia archaeon]